MLTGSMPSAPAVRLDRAWPSATPCRCRFLPLGASWHKIAPVLPNLAAPSTAAGVLPVSITKHSVAAPFVATYGRLTHAQVLGYPVTEAYLQDGVLTQDFEHLRLQLVDDQVSIAPLGMEVLAGGGTPGAPGARTGKKRPGPDPLFAKYYAQHGGVAVLGLPITVAFVATNGDGSKRRFRMQYFQNARVEFHPEQHDPHFQLMLGLLGTQSVTLRGWRVLSR
jgi:hypothetical protein